MLVGHDEGRHPGEAHFTARGIAFADLVEICVAPQQPVDQRGIDADTVGDIGQHIPVANYARTIASQHAGNLDAGIHALRDPEIAPVQRRGAELNDFVAGFSFGIRVLDDYERLLLLLEDEGFHFLIWLTAPLVSIDVLEHAGDIVAVLQAGLGLTLDQLLQQRTFGTVG